MVAMVTLVISLSGAGSGYNNRGLVLAAGGHLPPCADQARGYLHVTFLLELLLTHLRYL